MNQAPVLISGNHFSDERGRITFNNSFNAVEVKRIYFIENQSIDFVRGWQGHKIEQRWFLCVKGAFEIKVIQIDNWEKPTSNLVKYAFHLNAENSDILHVPNGYITSIQALERNSKLMAMSDYLLGELKDEYRFAMNHFN